MIKNDLGEYIPIFEKNKINEIEIIIDLHEIDYEKMGIEIMGDRKKLLKIFSKYELKKTIKNIQVKSVNDDNSSQEYEENKSSIHLSNNQIKIIRLNSVVGSALLLDVRFNNKSFQLENGEEIVFNAENGKHIISSSFNNDYEKLEFEINNNSKVFNVFIKPPLTIQEA